MSLITGYDGTYQGSCQTTNREVPAIQSEPSPQTSMPYANGGYFRNRMVAARYRKQTCDMCCMKVEEDPDERKGQSVRCRHIFKSLTTWSSGRSYPPPLFAPYSFSTQVAASAIAGSIFVATAKQGEREVIGAERKFVRTSPKRQNRNLHGGPGKTVYGDFQRVESETAHGWLRMNGDQQLRIPSRAFPMYQSHADTPCLTWRSTAVQTQLEYTMSIHATLGATLYGAAVARIVEDYYIGAGAINMVRMCGWKGNRGMVEDELGWCRDGTCLGGLRVSLAFGGGGGVSS
ncbi:hypothetical protein QR685DRAFT_602480 [Neurospora intermedia]|uniref:Uncharacterized protein n=1 Tax=Neurospora intermedia TaxID=5142 RepID=A0ABR3DTI6_NEUIN